MMNEITRYKLYQLIASLERTFGKIYISLDEIAERVPEQDIEKMYADFARLRLL